MIITITPCVDSIVFYFDLRFTSKDDSLELFNFGNYLRGLQLVKVTTVVFFIVSALDVGPNIVTAMAWARTFG